MHGNLGKKDGAGSLASWSFSTKAIAAQERDAAWAEAMQRLRLPFQQTREHGQVSGSVFAIDTPLGVQFSTISASPYIISGRPEDPGDGIWVSILLEGKALARAEGFSCEMRPLQILYGIAGHPATLELLSDHKQLFVRIPAMAISSRLLAPPDQPLMLIDAHEGLENIFARFLEATAEQISKISAEQLFPAEIALIEFLTMILPKHGSRKSKGGAIGMRASLFEMTLQSLELLLDDPELNLGKLSASTGLSVRTLSRLFSENETTFNAHVRERRLQRCYLELSSPIHAQLSISEIAFRWGFNSSAHFSRAFRSQFGTSPRELRKALAEG